MATLRENANFAAHPNGNPRQLDGFGLMLLEVQPERKTLLQGRHLTFKVGPKLRIELFDRVDEIRKP